MIELRAGMLLVAAPRLIDPNFYRSVVLLLEYASEGCVGLVLNQETDEAVDDHLPLWGDRVVRPGLIYRGGPVDPEVGMGLVVGEGDGSTPVPGLSLVDLTREPVPESPTGIKVYSGYAGWSAGQLEDEIATGSWFVVPASPDDPFADPTHLWRTVLRRQSGPLATMSTFPDDPTLN